MNSPHYRGYEHSGYNRSKWEASTAQKIYNLEQSQKRYEQLLQENILLKQQIDRSRYQNPVASHCHNCSQSQIVPTQPLTRTGDLVLWSMLQRNKYLEQKIDKLQGQYQRQSQTISRIKHSQKWKSRFTCNPQSTSCYEQKYLQLLRVRSPFY